MEQRPVFVRQGADGEWLLKVHVQPGARREEPAGLHGESLKVKIGAPAVDNKANEALVLFIAKALGLRRGQVELAAGQASRAKTLRIRAAEEPDWTRLGPVR